MKRSVLIVSLITILAGISLGAQMPGDKPVAIRLDPALDPLVSTDAKLDLGCYRTSRVDSNVLCR